MSGDGRCAEATDGRGRRGAAFWRAVHQRYAFELDESELLVEACRILGACESLQTILARDGEIISGADGSPKSHPASVELRQKQVALGRLLSQLGLPHEDGKSLTSALTARNRKGAAAQRAGVNVSEAARAAAHARWH